MKGFTLSEGSKMIVLGMRPVSLSAALPKPSSLGKTLFWRPELAFFHFLITWAKAFIALAGVRDAGWTLNLILGSIS